MKEGLLLHQQLILVCCIQTLLRLSIFKLFTTSCIAVCGRTHEGSIPLLQQRVQSGSLCVLHRVIDLVNFFPP